MPLSNMCPFCCSPRIAAVLESATLAKYRCEKCGKHWTVTESGPERREPVDAPRSEPLTR